ncbi:MAG: hypothetical protein B7Z37_20225 [Verrucomicrobia bacterium 12-59-8]|nr:MAG: hypothetical protein B7Z37_20225 [Verrucomicrobia bacterium 12-59-8]
MNRKNPAVTAHIANAKKWQAEMKALRCIILDTGLTEELKWDQPCYTHDGANIVLLGGFKDHCRLMFCNGSLLSDPRSLLQKPGEHTQAGRFIPFTTVDEIKALEPELKSFLLAAIENEKAGLKPTFKTTPEPIPEELQKMLNKNPALDEAFAALTPGRQRAYLLHFNSAKQSATRTSRIEACTPRILSGKGIHDCICCHSKKMPTCDGSHRFIQ